jgi:hypothetical protein
MRFLFVLLVACLALPAIAAPHCAPLRMEAMVHHGLDRHHPAPAEESVKPHDCIGCVAPIDGLDRFADRAGPRMRALGRALSDAAISGGVIRPMTPPPKTFA